MTDTASKPAPELAVVSGHVSALRLFDVAYAIDLGQAEVLWTRHAAGRAGRARLAVTARLYDFGAVTLALRIEASAARTELMEAAILLLIFVELVVAVTRH